MLKNISNNKKWLFSLLLIFALLLVGWGISVLVNSFIPLWLSLGFSVIYSIEKWLSYYTRKYKIVGKIYRAILNLSIISLFGLLIWSGFSLFTQQFMQNPLMGSIVFLAELVIFIWLWRVVAKNSWRQPSMKLTVVSLICLFVIFAFAGVQPFSETKAQMVSWFSQVTKLQLSTNSEMPADISGTVMVTDTVVWQGEIKEIKAPTDKGIVYWIVDISVDNKSYQDAVTANPGHWKIKVGDKTYDAHGSILDLESSYPMTVSAGGKGQTIIRFAVPDTLKVSSAELCYQGQEPHSYGKLTGGDKVLAWDWASKTAITKLSKVTDNWRIDLEECKISGNKVYVELSVTSLWAAPRYFGGDFLSPYTFICIDQYGKIFEDAIEERKEAEAWQKFLEGEWFPTEEPEPINFYKGEYYPNETRTGELEFIVNPRSGDVALYIGRFVGFTTRLKLFDLGTVGLN